MAIQVYKKAEHLLNDSKWLKPLLYALFVLTTQGKWHTPTTETKLFCSPLCKFQHV